MCEAGYHNATNQKLAPPSGGISCFCGSLLWPSRVSCRFGCHITEEIKRVLIAIRLPAYGGLLPKAGILAFRTTNTHVRPRAHTHTLQRLHMCLICRKPSSKLKEKEGKVPSPSNNWVLHAPSPHTHISTCIDACSYAGVCMCVSVCV